MAPLRDARLSLAQKRPAKVQPQAASVSIVAPVTAGEGARGARSLVAWSAGPSRTGGEAQSTNSESYVVEAVVVVYHRCDGSRSGG